MLINRCNINMDASRLWKNTLNITEPLSPKLQDHEPREYEYYTHAVFNLLFLIQIHIIAKYFQYRMQM